MSEADQHSEAVNEAHPSGQGARSRYDFIKSPPGILAICLTILSTIVIPFAVSTLTAYREVGAFGEKIAGLTTRLERIEKAQDTSIEKFAQLQSGGAERTREIENINRLMAKKNDVEHITKIVAETRQTLDYLYKSFTGVKNGRGKRVLQKSFSVAIVCTFPALDSGGVKVQKTHIIDAYTRTLHTFRTTVTDDQDHEKQKAFFVGRAFCADVSCYSFSQLAEMMRDSSDEIDFPTFMDPKASFIFGAADAAKVIAILPWKSDNPTSEKIDLKLPNFYNLLDEINSNCGRFMIDMIKGSGPVSKFPPYRNTQALLRTLMNLAAVHVVEQQFSDAERLYSDGLAIARELNNIQYEGILLRHLGIISMRNGKHDKAESYLTEALKCYQTTGDIKEQTRSLRVLGLVAAQRGRLKAAEWFALQGLGLAERTNDVYMQGSLLACLGVFAAAESQDGKSVQYLEKALELFRRIDSPKDQLKVLHVLAQRAQIVGNLAKTLSYLNQVSAISLQSSDRAVPDPWMNDLWGLGQESDEFLERDPRGMEN